MASPVRTDEQIVPRNRWVPIGKSNCYLDEEKSQRSPIFKIAVDILKQTNFFRAFTASSTIPAIYIQQFWDTIRFDRKAGSFKCQLDEQCPNTREQSGQPVMIREEDDRISVALDPQTLSSGFCISTEWEVVFLGGTMLAEVILVKGHELPNIVKVLPVGFHLSPTSVNT
ncbi:hypothetical protein Tco_0216586 [Tanacetum coccineum]